MLKRKKVSSVNSGYIDLVADFEEYDLVDIEEYERDLNESFMLNGRQWSRLSEIIIDAYVWNLCSRFVIEELLVREVQQ